MTAPAYPPLALSERLWRPPGVIAAPNTAGLIGTATATTVSGTAYYVGGPGCVLPAGTTAQSISFLSAAAAVSPTNTWFFLAMPDDELAATVVLATSEEDGTTAWPANTVKTLSLLAADGGSGAVTVTADTPVYIGVVQVATTPATLRGLAASANAVKFLEPKQWVASGQTGLTVPQDMTFVINMGDTAVNPCACYVSGV